MLTPSCAKVNVYLLIFIRILEGFCEGVTYPCIHSLWMKWAPPLERSKLATFAFSGSYVGTVIAFPLSGALAKTFGWASIFYVFGLLAIVWFFLWWWLVAEAPSDHDTISREELEYIQQSIGFTQQQVKGQPVPWRCILTSLPVWAIVFAHFAENWGFYTLLTELPTFLSDVMHFDVYQAGFAAAAPYLVMAIMIQIGGQIADAIRSRNLLSTTATRKTFNCTAFLFQTLFFIISVYMTSAKAALTCISLAVGFGGFAWSGFSVNHLDIAPQYASLLMGLSNTFATIPGMISPALTGHIAADGTKEEWRIIFYIAGVIYCCGAVFYGIFASGERQPWADMQPGYAAHADEPAESEE
ncbi:hypothetical protein CAPTEDRAFT_21080 [Capitella teleta]|uniref:Major facilitator superfamily (MFS) profile domain-containing protein n=1 Tax=Capitella teleta TaxID=283909 RepID=R7TCE0_CAPTE|nr:hypothetical protein CAPTEDRAFT_21080 [Capitella teleta]|eukprot:ELT91388.1 hypothetical protein CAPTEDRAFT_21080 [Capitella teleta]